MSSEPTLSETYVAGTVGFEEFYRSNYRSVLRLAYTMSGSWAAAEDLTHEAFEAAYRRWHEVGNYRRSEAWVRQVVVNKARSRLRRLYAEASARLRLRTPRHYEIPESTDDFWALLRALPRQQAAALALHYLEARTTAEIAAILGCAPSTARVHLHNGRKALATRLGVEEDG